MATGKRYYWIKLKDSFLTSDTVDFFMEQPNGANYVVLYQLLLLKTINTEGRLERQIGDVIIPYDVNKIQRDTKWFSVDTIRVALELYKQFGLVYEDSDGVLVMADHKNLVGSATDYAVQKAQQKARKKALNAANETMTGVEGVEMFHTDVHAEVHEDVHSSVHTNVHTDIRDKEIKRLDTRDRTIDTGSATAEALTVDDSSSPSNLALEVNQVSARSVFDSAGSERKERTDPFEVFWNAYPRQVGRGAAKKSFDRAIKKTTLQEMLAAIEKQKNGAQWQKNNGQFIPNPATWLNQERWADKVKPAESYNPFKQMLEEGDFD